MPEDALRCHRIWMKVLARVEDSSDFDACWIWKGPTSGNGRGRGYPRMSLDGQTVPVHRVMFTLLYGYIPSKKQIDHTCRNRCCVNPRHLEMVTHKENQKRRDRARITVADAGFTCGQTPSPPDA